MKIIINTGGVEHRDIRRQMGIHGFRYPCGGNVCRQPGTSPVAQRRAKTLGVYARIGAAAPRNVAFVPEKLTRSTAQFALHGTASRLDLIAGETGTVISDFYERFHIISLHSRISAR